MLLDPDLDPFPIIRGRVHLFFEVEDVHKLVPTSVNVLAWPASAHLIGARAVTQGYVIETMRSIARRARSASSGSTVMRCLPSRSESRTFSSVVTFM